MSDVRSMVERVEDFIDRCRLETDPWRFASTPGGPETLYASCFACMLLHYIGKLDELNPEQKKCWVNYLNSWQDPESGYFIGPELDKGELKSKKHSFEHIAQHLAAHVLPALSLLGAKPVYPLTFARPFLNLGHLHKWLAARDLTDAWLEGNNLLFVGQFLIHLRDVENLPSAQVSLDHYFEWLDQKQDPATGLWGSDGYCSTAVALYGGYHQLLVYYYEKRPVRFPENLIESALSLQHPDGGFHLGGGGGACEDVDAVDILVNMYKYKAYKQASIRAALRRSTAHVLKRQMPDGGFVYRLNEPFIHMGIQKTASAANHSNLFSTWFRIHTLALIAEVLTDETAIQWNWGFNNSCSMGWHPAWNKEEHRLTEQDRRDEAVVSLIWDAKRWWQVSPQRVRFLLGQTKRRLRRVVGYE